MKFRVPLFFILLFLGSFVSSGPLIPAHGVVPGLVCLADPTSAASNPADPCLHSPGPVFNGPLTNPGQQIRIGVFVNASAGLNGFDITLLADHNVLKPEGVDLSGTVLSGTPSVVLECLSGVLVKGSICLSTDTPDTLAFAAVAGLGLGPTATPTTGLLFTAIYNISRVTATGGVPVGFQTGCNTGTSVAGGVCITVSNGGTSAVSESAQGGSFDNSTPPPFVTITSSPSSFGPESPVTINTASVNLTANGGYPELAADSVSLTTVASPGLTATLTGTNPCATSGTFCLFTLTASASVGGNYSVRVLAQYSTVDLRNFNTSTLVAQATVRVIVTDFAVSADPSSVSPVLAGVVGSSVVVVKSVNGFTGTVGLAAFAPGYRCSLSPASVLVSGSANSMLSCSSFSAGNSVVTVTAASGLRSRTVQVGFSVQDFAVSVSSSSVSLLAGSNETIFLTVAGVNGFGQRVRLSITPPTGLTVDPAMFTFSPPGRVSLLIVGKSAGVYNLTLTISSSTLSHSLMVQVRVAPGAVSGSSSLYGVSPVVFLSLFGVLGALAFSFVVLGFRRRRRHFVSGEGAG